MTRMLENLCIRVSYSLSAYTMWHTGNRFVIRSTYTIAICRYPWWGGWSLGWSLSVFHKPFIVFVAQYNKFVGEMFIDIIFSWLVCIQNSFIRLVW